MREGMILEVHNYYVIVLTKTGEFLKLQKKGSANVGDLYKGKIYRRIPYFYTAAAAILLVIFTSLASYTAYAHQIVGYIDISGNKSVRLYINRMGNVQKVDGISNSSALKNLPAAKAVDELNSFDSKNNIFNGSKDLIVSTKDLKPSHVNLQSIKNKVEDIINSKKQQQNNNNNGNNSTNGNNNTNINTNNNDKTDTNSGSPQKQQGQNNSHGKFQDNKEKAEGTKYSNGINSSTINKILSKTLAHLHAKDKK